MLGNSVIKRFQFVVSRNVKCETGDRQRGDLAWEEKVREVHHVWTESACAPPLIDTQPPRASNISILFGHSMEGYLLHFFTEYFKTFSDSILDPEQTKALPSLLFEYKYEKIHFGRRNRGTGGAARDSLVFLLLSRRGSYNLWESLLKNPQ